MSWPNDSTAGMAQRAVELIAVLRPADPDTVVSAADVAAVLRAHGEPDPIEIGEADLAQMRAVAGDLLAVLTAPDTAAAARQLNQLLGRYAGPPRLSSHDTTAWHLHVDRSEAPDWAPWLATSSAMALALVLTSRQARPGGVCAAKDCQQPYIDYGKGAPRRYCSARCASRARVSAYRAASGGRAKNRRG